MITFGKSLLEFFKNILTVAGPIIIILFTLALLAGMIRWTTRTKDYIKEVSRNPIMLVLWIVLTAIGIYFFYKYAIPLFR